ncbi:C-type lectin domain family 4 member K, partial [Galemys pyrenaicus]
IKGPGETSATDLGCWGACRMKAAEGQVLDAHFSVDKQNISLWPRGKTSACWSFNKSSLLPAEPPPKMDPPLALRKCPTVRTVVIFLTLVLAASVLLQTVLYPWLMGTISDVKTNAQLLKGRVDNISSLSSEIKRNRGSLEATGVQVWRVNASLDRLHAKILRLETGMNKTNMQIQILRSSWEEVHNLNVQIPDLKKDLDKASALNAKVRGLQNSLDNLDKLLKQQSDILQMVSQGWTYFQGNFYYFSHVAKTWYSAQQACVSKKSHLTSVTSDKEQEFLYKTIGEVPYWIGLTKEGSTGAWTWADDTPFNRAQSMRYWIPGEPNNAQNNEHCVNIKLYSLQSWNDCSCDLKFPFICKKPYIPAELFSPPGMDSQAMSPSNPKILRLVRAAVAFVTVTLVFSLVVLFLVVLQSPRHAPEDAVFQKLTGDNASGQLPVDPCKLQKTVQMFKCHAENSNPWSMDNISSQIQMLGGHLENTRADVQMAKNSLKDVSTLRMQTQVLRSSLEGANIEIQKLKGGVEKANALSSQTQSFLRSSLENTSTEIQLLRGGLERACNESHLLKRDLETVTTQTQVANSRLDQTDAQILTLKAELTDMNISNSQIQVLTGQLKNANREIQTLKQGMKDTATLSSKTETLESNLQKADAEIQRLNGSLESTKTLAAKVQETQSQLETLQASIASQMQLQRTNNQLLELILQGWTIYDDHLYYFSYIKKSWHEAEQFCVSQGAHLVSVTSVGEQAFLVKFTRTSYHWIGLSDAGTEGSWRWVDGTPFDSAKSRAFWEKNQPDNWKHKDGRTEDCVQIQQKWNDNFCDSLYHWVCKKSRG